MTNETKEYTYMKDITNYTAAKYSRGGTIQRLKMAYIKLKTMMKSFM